MEQDLTQLAVILLCDDSTGCDEMGEYFATEADTIIDIVCEVELVYRTMCRFFIYNICKTRHELVICYYYNS